MIDVSDAFRDAATSVAPSWSIRVTIGEGDSATVLGPEDLQTVQMTYSGDSSYTIGSVQSVECQMTVLTDSLPDGFVDQPFRVEIGCRADRMKWTRAAFTWASAHLRWPEVDRLMPYEWLPMGDFRTSDELVGEAGMFTEVHAYDGFYWMTGDCTTAYPSIDGTTAMSTRAQAEAIAGDAGLELDASSVPDLLLKTVRPAGKLRDALSQLGIATASCLWFEDGKLTFRKPMETGVTIGTGDYAAGAWAATTGEHTSVGGMSATVTKVHNAPGPLAAEGTERKDDEETKLTAGTGNMLAIDGKLFQGGGINADLKPKVWDAVQEDLDAIEAQAGLPMDLVGFSCEMWGFPWLRPLDWVTCENPYGKSYHVLCASVTVTYNGAVKTSIGCSASSDEIASASVETTVKADTAEEAQFDAVESDVKELAEQTKKDLGAAGDQIDAIREEMKTQFDETNEKMGEIKTTADGRNRVFHGPVSQVPANPVQGDIWFVTGTRTVPHYDDDGNETSEDKTDNAVVGVRIFDGAGWNSYAMYLDELAVPGSAGMTVIKNGAVTTSKLTVDDLAAVAARIGGMVLRDGAIYTPGKTSTDDGKTSVDDSSEGFYFDYAGNFAIGDGESFVRYVVPAGDSEQGQLDVCVAKLKISGSEHYVYFDGSAGVDIGADGSTAKMRFTGDGFKLLDSQEDSTGKATETELATFSAEEARLGRLKDDEGKDAANVQVTPEKVALRSGEADRATVDQTGFSIYGDPAKDADGETTSPLLAKFEQDGTSLYRKGKDEDGNEVMGKTVKFGATTSFFDGTDEDPADSDAIVRISKKGIDGIFYAGSSQTMAIEVPADSTKTFSVTRKDIGDAALKVPWRCYALTRLTVSGSHYLNVSGWNCNPGGSDTLFRVRVVNTSISSKRNGTLAFQILWMRGTADSFTDDGGSSGDTDEDTHGNDHFVIPSSGGNQKLGMSRSGSTLSITWKDA